MMGATLREIQLRRNNEPRRRAMRPTPARRRMRVEALPLLAQESAKKQKPLWKQHAKNFFDWNGKELKENGLEGFLDELEEFLMPQS